MCPSGTDPRILAGTEHCPAGDGMTRTRRLRGIIWPRSHGGRDGHIPDPDTRTRTQLYDERRRNNLPDLSFDVDNDGFVSAEDFRMSNQFDVRIAAPKGLANLRGEGRGGDVSYPRSGALI